MKAITPRFCPLCGGRVVEPLPGAHGGAPLICSACQTPLYLDPKVAAAVVVNLQDGVVLLRRAQKDAAYGKWILPGGHVDRGEAVERAALREAVEETGLELELQDLLGVYSYPGYPVVLIVYLARVLGGSLTPNSEALEARVFAPGEIPWDQLGYESTGQALRDFFAREG